MLFAKDLEKLTNLSAGNVQYVAGSATFGLMKTSRNVISVMAMEQIRVFILLCSHAEHAKVQEPSLHYRIFGYDLDY